MTAHAPSANFVIEITTRTIAVATAPAPLISEAELPPGLAQPRWRLAIPACESEKEVNTPIA